MDKLRIMSVFGTRPEAIKMCPLVQELASRPEIESLCCVTAQHRQMLDSVLEVFHVKPDWDLDIMTPRQWSTATPPPPLPAPCPPSTIRSRWAMWRRDCGPMTSTLPSRRR